MVETGTHPLVRTRLVHVNEGIPEATKRPVEQSHGPKGGGERNLSVIMVTGNRSNRCGDRLVERSESLLVTNQFERMQSREKMRSDGGELGSFIGATRWLPCALHSVVTLFLLDSEAKPPFRIAHAEASESMRALRAISMRPRYISGPSYGSVTKSG
jgi:hypothetical protein